MLKHFSSLSIRHYVYLLIVAILALTLSLGGYLRWQDSVYAKGEEIANRYHLATILYCTQIKEELQYMLRHQAEMKNKQHKTDADINKGHEYIDHIYFLEKHFAGINHLQKTYSQHAAGYAEYTPILRKIRRQLDYLVERWHAAGAIHSADFLNSVTDMPLILTTSIDQLQRLHTIDQRNLLARLQTEKEQGTRNLYLLLTFMLVFGTLLTGKILGLIKRILYSQEQAEHALQEANNELEQRVLERTQDLLSEKQFSDTMIDSLPGIFYLFDEQGRFLRWNHNLETASGYSNAEIAQMRLVEFFHDEEHPNIEAKIKEALSQGQAVLEANLLAKNGGTTPYFLTCDRIEREDSPCIIGMGIDITERKQAQARQIDLGQMIKNSLNEIYIFDKASLQFIYANQSARENLGYTMKELKQLTPVDLKPKLTLEAFRDLIKPLQSSRQNKIVFEAVHQSKDGTTYWAEVHLQNSTYAGQPVLSATILDITQRKQAAELIEHQATFDALTDLPNRRLLRDRMVQALARCRRHGHMGAVLYIDLDNFKHINDSLGHPVGDELLQEVARRLKECMREEDTPARLGGDEFVVLFSELTDKPEEAAQLAQLGAEKIQKVLSMPFLVQGHELHVTPSIGIAMFPTEDENADDILKYADTAMYRAKEAGRNAIRFFLPSMQFAAEERLKLQNDLREALKREEFHLDYQPQVDDAGHILGAEALLRWRHPVRGLVAPDDFIQVAEETGQILAIGEWVLENALTQLKAWTDEISTASFKRLAINVSPRQFHEANFATRVERILAETGANPEHLTLEITEGILVQNLEETIQKIETLKKLGIRFSVDDFGTGYSSLAYLKRLPLDEIKIDRSFVRDITIDPSDANLVETIITMAQHLGLEVIAEGVETEEQLHFLLERGCRYFQGYYFSRPQTVDDFTKHLLRPEKYTKGPSGSM